MEQRPGGRKDHVSSATAGRPVGLEQKGLAGLWESGAGTGSGRAEGRVASLDFLLR